MRERNRLESAIDGFLQMESEFSATCELLEMAAEEGDAAMEAEAAEAVGTWQPYGNAWLSG